MQITLKVPEPLLDCFRDPCFPIAYNATDDAVDIWLHGVVGDEFTATDSLSIGQVLSANRGKSVTLRVNSPGGLAYDGVAIFNAIQSHDGPTTGVIEGLAGSAASLAVIACDTVNCHTGAVFHPHYSLVMAMGHQAEVREALAIQERLDEDLEVLYMDASGRSLKDVQADLMGPNGDGTRFSAEQAKAAGYVDNVLSKKGAKAELSSVHSDRLRQVAARHRHLKLLTRES